LRYSLDQLQTFAKVAQVGSFSAAARELNKTQSTVSLAIANLEVDVGVVLFDRTKRIPTLTEPGSRLLREALEVLDRCLALDRHAQSFGSATESQITLAIEIPYVALMKPLVAFAEAFPFVDLDIRHPINGDVSALVENDHAQFGVAFAQPNYSPEIEFTQIGKLILSHVVARTHPLAGQKEVSFADLRRHRRLSFSAHSERLPTTEYLQVARRWRAENYQALLEMARNGLGWATLPRQLIMRELTDGDLVELRLAAYPHTDWLLGVDLLWNKSRPLGQVGTWLHSELRRHKVSESDSAGNPTTF
jgi:DNA-binding transcriptional LysR family regulator